MQKIKIKYSSNKTKRLTLPRSGDVGIDLYANETLLVPAGQTKLVHTGVSLEIPEGYWLQLLDRSSVSKHCHVLAGVIDTSYRGEVCIRMYCHTEAISLTGPDGPLPGYLVTPGLKIAQAVIRKDHNSEFELEEVDSLSETTRGTGGFGSTGNV
jgi:dUTP pyrophosphatase